MRLQGRRGGVVGSAGGQTQSRELRATPPPAVAAKPPRGLCAIEWRDLFHFTAERSDLYQDALIHPRPTLPACRRHPIPAAPGTLPTVLSLISRRSVALAASSPHRLTFVLPESMALSTFCRECSSPWQTPSDHNTQLWWAQHCPVVPR